MRYLYLKGMSTDDVEFSIIRDKFKKHGMELINVVDDYAELYGMDKNEIEKYLLSKINKYPGEKCLICHSMGCNFGVLISSEIKKLVKVMFVSPEWQGISREERRLITPSSNIDKYPSKEQVFSTDKIKNISLFLKSRRWLNQTEKTRFNLLFLGDISKDIFYSKGDPYVSRKGIEALEAFENVTVTEIDTNNHNPILETDDIVLKASEIKDYLVPTGYISNSCSLLDSFQNEDRKIKALGSLK